ncbi:uncharacterized protein L3040_003125 [Drepanopeziza brunnea f. sp. 'multigermtubi']|uniref:Uncharacterized protein n=1 Tax=Marssonina brunnea f. sp. multigermtubi (strain MB_m1) TaxID=1072389 RepID=K1WRV8_MARBU|nr:uncharacterized protein MBM_05777 [Drepanopeziza brunnea f. sp. 'multigermtubi' MB_m1]EKD15766.1 hypothetical protein MBM_05777 [Drepanopeziza brunnea f. sp. 'multigermtubi' MB_m1]KAJ5047293.1 hypothetical protein L3040_003125 [Drepanopeziza brunnea f. sp. 'multigermtubi']
MLPTSLLMLTASLVTPIIAATAPSCVAGPDATGYAAQKLPYLYNNLCKELSTANFGTREKLYDAPVIALSFSARSVGECSLASCLIGFKTLVDGCDRDDKSIWGSGSFESSCGVFSFSVWAPEATASLGKPRATLTAATMKTYDIASLLASTSTSRQASTSSSRSKPTSSASRSSSRPSSTPSPTSTSSSARMTSYSAQPPTTTTHATLTSTYAKSNSTSGLAGYNSTASATSTYIGVMGTGSQTVPGTKPDVGDGTANVAKSGAGMIRVSGLSLVAVASVFGVFL